MRIREIAKDWWPVAAVLVVSVTLWRACLPGDEMNVVEPLPTTEPYAPIEVLGFHVDTYVHPVPVGARVTLHNGLCNRSATPITVTVVSFGLQQVGRDPVFARQHVLASNRTFTMGANECVLDDRDLDGPLPPEIVPGLWKIYASMVVMGAQAGQVQRITLETGTFRVVEAPS